MAQIILSMPDEQVNTFLKFISDLKYVKVEEAEFMVPEWQIKEVRRRIKKIRKDPSRLIDHKISSKRLKSLIFQ